MQTATIYIQSDIPTGMTCDEYRRMLNRSRPTRRNGVRRARRWLGRLA